MRPMIWGLAALALGGCELAEVAAPPSADVLVVEAVLRAGGWRQTVLLHRSVASGVVGGERGAAVTVTGPDGIPVPFEEQELEYCVLGDSASWGLEGIEVDASCYVSPSMAAGSPGDEAALPLVVQPGATYELRVDTDRGEVIRARTTVPSDSRFVRPSVDAGRRTTVCALPNTPFELVWTPAEGAWSYLISLQLSNWSAVLREQGIEAPDPLELTGVAVSAMDTTLLFPAELGLFQRGEFDQRIFELLRAGLPAGSESILVVLAADRNYTNSIRGGRFNPSGNVRLSSVVGDGVGVFGSVVPLLIRSVRPEDGSPLPPCPM